MAVAAERIPLLRRNISSLPEDDDGQERPLHQREIGSYFIVAAEMFERLTCYSISGMLLVFLTNPPLCFSPSSALAVQFMFIATVYMFCLVAGAISDSYISRHTTIILGYFIYIIGYSIWMVATFAITMNIYPFNNLTERECDKCRDSTISDQNYNIKVILLIAALFTISVGAAIVRANLAVFGAQQVRIFGSIDTRKFMTRYYWATNMGVTAAFFAITFMQGITTATFGLGVFLSGSIVLSLLLYLSGCLCYIRRRPEFRFVAKDIFKVVSNARKVKKNNPDITEDQYLEYSNQAKGYPGAECTLQEISDAGDMSKIVRVVLLMIPYWICYSQVSGGVYMFQGLHMSSFFGPPFGKINKFCHTKWQLLDVNYCSNVSASNMHLQRFFPFPILTLTPAIASNLAVVILLPFAHMFYRFLTRHNFIVYTYRRLVVGMLLASLSLLAAGATETARLQDIYQNGVSFEPLDLTAYAVSPKVKVYYQFIQYCFMGMSEIFFIATSLEYIYMKSPVHMQGLSMGLFWFSAGIGHVIGLAFTTIFGVTDNINCGYLHVYFYFLGFLLGIYTIIFYKCCKYFHLGLHRMIILPLPTG